MNQQVNAMQESIKIALDAADAATDVTSEYKRIKNEHLKAEQKVKEIHKYTTIVFSSSIATAVIAITAVAIELEKTIVVYLCISFTFCSAFIYSFLIFLYSDVTSVAASAASKAILMLSCIALIC